MQAINLNTPLIYLKGVGPKRAELLQKELGLSNLSDLLSFYPFRHIDRSRFYTIGELNEELPAIQIIGKIVQKSIVGEKQKRRLVIKFTDSTGQMELVWFQNIKWFDEHLTVGKHYLAFGKVSLFNTTFSISHPEMENYPRTQNTVVGNVNLQPIYSSTEKLKKNFLDSKGIQKLTQTVIENHFHEINESLPQYILDKYRLIGKPTAIKNIHFPKDIENLKQAERRLKFDELFFIQLQLLYNKQIKNSQSIGAVFNQVGHYVNTFYTEILPFNLTSAQKRVIKEIRLDTQKGTQMNRLVQGDVGSGKTVVAFMSMLLAADNGYQSCMMAPTEILARQHFESICNLVGEQFIRVELLTGSTSTKHRRELLSQLQSGELHILVGTHALLEDKVKFKNLGLAVIDEQHRFGVEQRAKLWRKNQIAPHILVMTATPIPRTLAMTLYGDLDVSVIDELPAGRKPINTIHLLESQRLRMFGFLRDEIAKGRQVYVVYPLIQESEKLDLLHLEAGIEQLRYQFPLPKYQISIVHGKLSAADKQFEMQQFIEHKSQIMVATTVIEVGVNVPNASVMVIENAERFGLSQLHQLRGRVGRGAEQSYCILMSGEKLNPTSRKRIKTMVETNNGFEISEIDLELRGPGDLAGTKQSGVLDLKIANLAEDQSILQEARKTALEILTIDPNLASDENKLLRRHIDQTNSQISFEKIS